MGGWLLACALAELNLCLLLSLLAFASCIQVADLLLSGGFPPFSLLRFDASKLVLDAPFFPESFDVCFIFFFAVLPWSLFPLNFGFLFHLVWASAFLSGWFRSFGSFAFASFRFLYNRG